MQKEISFSNKSQSYCVCFVSMVDSVEVISEIKDPDKVRRYYAVFINTMAAIARKSLIWLLSTHSQHTKHS